MQVNQAESLGTTLLKCTSGLKGKSALPTTYDNKHKGVPKGDAFGVTQEPVLRRATSEPGRAV